MNARIPVVKAVILACLCFALLPPSPLRGASEGKSSYTLAVLPQLPAVAIHRNWAPFVERLSKEVGADIQLKVYQTTSQFEADVLKGAPDFAFMNPNQAVMAWRAHGYIPLVRDKKPVAGILFARKDAPINSIQELNGKEIAFVGPKTICSIVLRHVLSVAKGRIHFIPRYVGTASNVFRNVILGKIPVGGTLDTAFNREPVGVRSQLRIIYKTRIIAPHPLAARPDVPAKLRQAVIEAVLGFAENKENQAMLKAVQMAEPVKADYKRDYMPLERLGLEKYVIGGK
ncbi:MAG: phosphate/phosphite/phosphonate ABC transporter substrate-binding protein [Nitrospirae bacterium]|nr:phosphate/phosphite/phosphonate ABC transporter substrate-binding protein [Nitrospirota bacterium]